MKRRTFLRHCLAGGAAMAATPLVARAQTGDAPARPPNIIFLFADDQGYGDLGCYGHPMLRTPAIDRLAAQGCRFTDFYVTAPVCGPSRAGYLTGRDQNRFGMKFLCQHGRWPNLPRFHHVPTSEPSLARQLQSAGYRTGHIGKWHLSLVDQFPTVEPWPDQYGFDHYLVRDGGEGAHRDPSNWTRNGKRVPGKLAGWAAELYIDEAIRFIEQQPADRPFYLQIWSFTPHEMVDCPDEYKAMYADLTPQEQVYYGCITHMDAQYGRLLHYLDQRGLTDNTIVIFSSDNGPEHPNLSWVPSSRGSTGPLGGCKHVLYEGGIRVPGIVRWPGVVRPGFVCREPVSTLDLFPTLCAAAGAALPDTHPLDGTNLRRALEGGAIERARPLYWQYDLARLHRDGGVLTTSPQLALRDGRWKLLCDVDFSGVELYNLDIDAGEKWNLAERHPDIVARLLPPLRAMYADINSPYAAAIVPETLNPAIPALAQQRKAQRRARRKAESTQPEP